MSQQQKTICRAQPANPAQRMPSGTQRRAGRYRPRAPSGCIEDPREQRLPPWWAIFLRPWTSASVFGLRGAFRPGGLSTHLWDGPAPPHRFCADTKCDRAGPLHPRQGRARPPRGSPRKQTHEVHDEKSPLIPIIHQLSCLLLGPGACSALSPEGTLPTTPQLRSSSR